MENSVQNVEEAKRILNEVIPLVRLAEEKFKKARFWSVLDVFGGGLFSDLLKYSRLDDAKVIMNSVQAKLEQLQRVLGGIDIPVDFRMEFGGIRTFGDFLFDGLIFDGIAAARIFSSLDSLRKLENKLLLLNDRLAAL